MSEMLDRIAEAWTTYKWTNFVQRGELTIPVVYHSELGLNKRGIVGRCDTELKARQACKRMNARAVLDALMEPDEAMLKSGESAWMNRHPDDPASEPIKDCWQAMLTEAKGGSHAG